MNYPTLLAGVLLATPPVVAQIPASCLEQVCPRLPLGTLKECPATPTNQPSTPTSVGVSSSIEKAVHSQVNQYRATQGLPALQLDSRISELARQHSAAMAAGRVPFGHEGFSNRLSLVAQHIPYRSGAENVAYNSGQSDPARAAVQGWLQSPGHHRNIVGNYNRTGIGVSAVNGRVYFTQIFILLR